MRLLPDWWTWPSTVEEAWQDRSPPEMPGEHRRTRKFPMDFSRVSCVENFFAMARLWHGPWVVAIGQVEVVVSSLRGGSKAAGRQRRGSGRAFSFLYASVRVPSIEEPPDLGFNSPEGRAWHPGFVRKPLGREAPEKTVFRIVCVLLQGRGGGLTIGVTKHDRTVKILSRPLDEEVVPIKQLGMRRFFPRNRTVGASKSLAENAARRGLRSPGWDSEK